MDDIEAITEPRKWRSLTEPALICNDRVRKVYDATTGKTYPVEWVPIEQDVGLDNCG